MANLKRGVKARRLWGEKENIANIAKWILVAFCLQFVFYIGLINIVPMIDVETEELNGLYSEMWRNSKYSEGDLHTEGNGIKFIYTYNMVLLITATGVVLYYAMIFLEENEGVAIEKAKEFLKQNIGLLCLLWFMLWGFVSSCLAYDKFRSFIGCYNLRDGYFSFMFYGSILICILLMSLTNYSGKVGKVFGYEIEPKKLITNTFIVVMTLIAAITLGDYYELTDEENQFKGMVVQMADGSKSGDGIGISIEPKYTQALTDSTGERVLVTIPRATAKTVTSSVFNNSNHYAYVLSIAVIVAAALFIKSEKNIEKCAYLICFAILTWMLIINDTFGAYLGVMIALALMFIHAIVVMSKTKMNILYVLSIICIIMGFFFIDSIVFDTIVLIIATILLSISKTRNFEGLANKIGLVGHVGYIVLVFAIISLCVVNTSGKNIVVKNFDYISKSISDILSANSVEESDKNIKKEIIGISGEEILVETVSVEATTDNKDLSDIAAGDAGSGRWKLWVGAIEIIKKKPLFGAGLENMIYEYSELGIGEGRSHNLVLQLAGTIGVPGMLFYVAGVAIIFFQALRYFRIWDTYTYMGVFVMISYLISSLTGNSGFYTSGYFYIFVGFVVIGTIECRKLLGESNKQTFE